MQILFCTKNKVTEEYEDGKRRINSFLVFEAYTLSCPIYVIDCSVHSEQEQSHHAPNCIGTNKLIGRMRKLPLSVVPQIEVSWQWHYMHCTRVHHEYITNAWSNNHGLTSNITMFATNKATSATDIP